MKRTLWILLLIIAVTHSLPGQVAITEAGPKLVQILEQNADLGLNRFPIGFWNYTNLGQHGVYMDEAEVDEWFDAGFTVTLSSSFDPTRPEEVNQFEKILDWAASKGMKIIIVDPRTHGPPGGGGHVRTDVQRLPESYQADVSAAVRMFGNHPATFGFHIGDEPNRSNNDAFFEAYRISKRTAPHLHPFMNLLPWWEGAEETVGYDSWEEYLDAVVAKAKVDFLCYDCYSQMNPGQSGWDMYYKNLRLYREASWRNGVPFWSTILSVGHFRYRTPNYNELRWQFNTALASGANGILWFFYYMRNPHDNYRMSPVDEHWDRTQTYYDLRRIQKSFHRIYQSLFSTLVSTRVTFLPTPFGGGERFTPNELLASVEPDKEDHPLLIGEFVDRQGLRYVMLVNNSTSESVRVALNFPGKDTQLFSFDWHGRQVEGPAYSAQRVETTENGLKAWHWLAPGQEAVYRVESEQIRNLSPIRPEIADP